MPIEQLFLTRMESCYPATEVLGKENDIRIAKIAWLGRKDIGKTYGSMVVYVTKSSEAMRLLQGQYFHVAGESAYTRAFEPRYSPLQCYRCQGLGYKSFSCSSWITPFEYNLNRHTISDSSVAICLELFSTVP
jgi:hypothetical protein